MSGLCIYKFGDIAWGEIYLSADHTGSYPDFDWVYDPSTPVERCKRPCSESINVSNNTRDQFAATYAGWEKEQGALSPLSRTRNMTLEQCSWSPTPNGVFPSSSDSNSITEVSSLASDSTQKSSFTSNNTDPNRSDICENDAILGDGIIAVDKNSFSDPLSNINQSSKAVDFFEKSEEGNPSDFLYYGLPEIGSFDDVDRMFRNCDTTFGLGVCKEENLNWLSSDDVGESRDMMQSDFEFPPELHVVEDISANLDYSNSYSVHDSALGNAPIMFNDSSWSPEKSDPCMSFVTMNGPAVIDKNDGLNSKEQVNHKKQSENQNLSKGKRKTHYFENVDFSNVNELPNESEWCPRIASDSLYSSVHIQPQHLPLGPDSCNYLQNPVVYNQQQHPNRTRGNTCTTWQASICEPDSVGNLHFCENKFEIQIDVKGASPAIPAELGTSNVHESSTMSSSVDDIQLEGASFLQLQHVMEQLDLKTKLCLRDSLYRLAQGAEQRHNHANLNGVCGYEREACGTFMADEANGHPCFLGTETDTNPIDRSIAHLLFHRPEDATAVDALPFKSPRLIFNPLTSPPVMVNNLVVPEETSNVAEKQGFDR